MERNFSRCGRTNRTKMSPIQEWLFSVKRFKRFRGRDSRRAHLRISSYSTSAQHPFYTQISEWNFYERNEVDRKLMLNNAIKMAFRGPLLITSNIALINIKIIPIQFACNPITQKFLLRPFLCSWRFHPLILFTLQNRQRTRLNQLN